MKRIVPFLILIALFASSCGTTRKIAGSNVNKSDSTDVSVVKESLTTVSVDTTKAASGEKTVIEIEFFEPVVPSSDTLAHPSSPVITIGDDGIRIDNADNVKSVKATTTKTEKVAKGETKVEHEHSDKMDSVVVETMTAESHEESTPVEPSPGRKFKSYMLIIVATIIATIIGMLALKRTGFFGWVKKVLSLIAALFK